MKTNRVRTRPVGLIVGAALAASIAFGACADGGGSSSDEPEGPVDMQLAAQGERLFADRGCVACHTFGEGRLVGPDLEGVSARRSFDWIYALITAPDSMLQSDSTTKALFAEYLTPMPNQKVEPDEARALYEYLRARTEAAEDPGR